MKPMEINYRSLYHVEAVKSHSDVVKPHHDRVIYGKFSLTA